MEPIAELPDSPPVSPRRRFPRRSRLLAFIFSCLLVVVISVVLLPLWFSAAGARFRQLVYSSSTTSGTLPMSVIHTPQQPSPTFDPLVGAAFPDHRIVAYYAIPGAEATGPAFELTDAMLQRLQKQGAAYAAVDPKHPVLLAIDLVASVPDGFPGPDQTYSHHISPDSIQDYISFCQKHGLLLFLDLDFGQSPIMPEVNFFLPYLEKYSFVHLGIDPEWMFPRHDGIPGVNLSNVRASDINPIISALATIPQRYHVPQKILMIHQYRPDGDGLSNPDDPGLAEIANKRDLLSDPRVDVVIDVDSVGGFPGDHQEKALQYSQWVQQDMQKYHNFQYGGFKLFYNIEGKTGLMTPKQVLALNPAPMLVTYGN